MRRAEPLVHAAEERRQHAVARHLEGDARLAVGVDEQHGREAHQCADLDEDRDARPAHPVHRKRHGIRDAELAIGHDAGEDGGDGEVERRAHEQRAEDADRHVALRVARLRSRRRDRLESEVGEEQDRRGTHDAGPAERELAFVRRNERLPVVRGRSRRSPTAITTTITATLTTTRKALTPADCRTPAQSTAVTAAIASAATRFSENPPPDPTSGVERIGRHGDAEIAQQARQVAREADGERRRRERVLEHQDPAEAPGEHFAERGVAVAVGRTGYGHRGGELRVAERRERAGRARDHEGDHDGGTREVRGGSARQHVDAGAQDAADAEQHEVHRAERPAAGRASRLPPAASRWTCRQTGLLSCGGLRPFSPPRRK